MPVSTTFAAPYLETFEQLKTDDKLAVLWHLYECVRNESSMSQPNDNTAPDSSDDLFARVKNLSEDDQLQLMRDVVEGSDNELTREYKALTNSTRIAFWYQLAQGMEASEIVPVPSDYKPSDKAQSLVSELKPVGFEKQFIFIRSALLSDEGKPSV